MLGLDAALSMAPMREGQIGNGGRWLVGCGAPGYMICEDLKLTSAIVGSDASRHRLRRASPVLCAALCGDETRTKALSLGCGVGGDGCRGKDHGGGISDHSLS
jgi:hypothetical protein